MNQQRKNVESPKLVVSSKSNTRQPQSQQRKGIESPKLMVSEQDLSVDLQGKLKSLKEGKQVLGDHDDVQRALFDALPSVIAERVKAITPRDFVVAELELKLSLGGTIFGVGLSGDVTVKLAPRGDH